MAGTAYTIQIRQRGVVTIPTEIRQRYGLDEDDVLTLIDLGGTFVLIPKTSEVARLAREIEKKREKAGVSLEELIEGVRLERHHSSSEDPTRE